MHSVGSYCTDSDMQCTCSVILRRVHVTIVAVEKQKVLHIMSVCVALVIQHAKRHTPHYIVY